MCITMSKAVEILELNVKEGQKSMPGDVLASVKLSVSLMKAVQFARKGGSWDVHALVPDELPEE